MKGENYFRRDLERLWIIRGAESCSRLARLRVFLRDQGSRFVAVYRLDRYARRAFRRNRLLGFPLRAGAAVLYGVTALLCNIRIEGDHDFGPGLFVAHPSCIFIGGSLGANCILHQCTTIGWGYSDGKYGAPEIGDNVWIGPHAVISGKITVGANATIAAGAVVTRSVPEGALAVGNPARIVATDYDNNLLYVRR